MDELSLSQTSITGRYHFYVLYFSLESSTVQAWLPSGWSLAEPDPAIFPNVIKGSHPVAMELGRATSLGHPSQPSFTRFSTMEAKIIIPAAKRPEDGRILMYKKIIYMSSRFLSFCSSFQDIPARYCHILMSEDSYIVDDVVEMKSSPKEDDSSLARLQQMTVGDWASGAGKLIKRHWYDWKNAEFMKPITARLVLRKGAVDGWELMEDVVLEGVDGMEVSAEMRMT